MLEMRREARTVHIRRLLDARVEKTGPRLILNDQRWPVESEKTGKIVRLRNSCSNVYPPTLHLVYDLVVNDTTMGTYLEYKRFSAGFVLAALLVTNAPLALADELPPPPPPPPEATSIPPPRGSAGSSILEAPPPPPPGVNIELLPAPPPKPSSSTTKPPALEPKRARSERSRPDTGDEGKPNTLPDYRAEDQPRQTGSTKWYGWKSLFGLVPVYGLFAAGIATDEFAVIVPAAIGGVLITPIVHRAHGNSGRGWLSFGLNLGAPLIGVYAGGGYGALVGLGLWNTIDVLALHWEQKVVDSPKKAQGFPSFAIVPMMDHGRKGIALVGQF